MLLHCVRSYGSPELQELATYCLHGVVAGPQEGEQGLQGQEPAAHQGCRALLPLAVVHSIWPAQGEEQEGDRQEGGAGCRGKAGAGLLSGR